VSKQLVQRAFSSQKALALEDLSGIRDRANGFSRESRWLLGNWAFDQLGQFVSYKAKSLGVPVAFVDPRNTSRTCSACGHCDKANRKSQSKFECLSCGLVLNADFNAALNIRARAEVMPPIVPLAHE
jgi:IS605 OrfB family transposase